MSVTVRIGEAINIKNLRANTSKHLVDGMPIGIKARKYRDTSGITKYEKKIKGETTEDTGQFDVKIFTNKKVQNHPKDKIVVHGVGVL